MLWTKYSLTNILDNVILGSIRGLSLGFSVDLDGSVGLLLLVVVGLRGGRWIVDLTLLNVVVSGVVWSRKVWLK